MGVFVLVVKQLIIDEPVNGTFVVFALIFFTIALVFLVVGRKSGGGSGPPSA